MKRLSSLLFLVMLGACAKNNVPAGDGMFSLQLQPQIGISEHTKGNVGDYALIPVAGNFKITIKNYASSVAWEGKLSEFDPSTKFPVGEYTVIAEYGNPEEEGKQKPSFSAQENYTIVELETTPVTLKPSLSNCIVKVQPGQYLKNYFSAYSFSITTAAGNKFDMAEGDAIFMDAYKFTLNATLTTKGGDDASFSKTFEGLEAAHCYTVKIELDNVGGNSFTISFNDNVETVTIEEDLN